MSIRAATAALFVLLLPGAVGAQADRASEAGSSARDGVALAAVDVVAKRESREARAARLTGRVMAAAAAGPLAGVTVAIAGTALRGVTDHEGRYAIDSVPAGRATLTVTRLDGRTTRLAVTLPERDAVRANVWLGATLDQPSRGFAEREMDRLRLSAAEGEEVSGLVVAGASMKAFEEEGADLVRILRDRFPVRTGYPGSGGVCVEDPRDVHVPARRPQSSASDPTPCAMILVFLDDDVYRQYSGMSSVEVFLLAAEAKHLESVAFVSRDELRVTPGLGNRQPRSALILHTRGYGPFVDPARD